MNADAEMIREKEKRGFDSAPSKLPFDSDELAEETAVKKF